MSVSIPMEFKLELGFLCRKSRYSHIFSSCFKNFHENESLEVICDRVLKRGLLYAVLGFESCKCTYYIIQDHHMQLKEWFSLELGTFEI